jgi:PqqD family protein of HPr-rel-A system
VQAAVKWRLVPADSLCWREWDGEIVVFNDLTGNTHLLNPLAGLVWTRLVESRAMFSAAELTESIGQSEAIEQDVALIEAIGEVLDDLERLGLAECDPE